MRIAATIRFTSAIYDVEVSTSPNADVCESI
jgi:hypothetical protein